MLNSNDLIAPNGKYRIMKITFYCPGGADYFPYEDHASLDEALQLCRELNKNAKKETIDPQMASYHYVTDDTGTRRRKKRKIVK